jgi:hypothetical protein
VAQYRVHHNVLLVDKEVAHRDQEWPVHVQVLFVQVLLHVLVHRVLLVVDLLHVQADQLHHHPHLHTNQIHQELVHQVVVHSVQVAVVHHNVVAQVEHLERMQVRNQDVNKSLVRRYVMSSTICRHHNLVAQLFLTVMARLQFACVVEPLWQISQTRLVQIQQH